MQLISCHIENFGALHDADYDFEQGMTVLCRENGAGKTTLAAFIKAMFYGLPSTTARSKFNERQHYNPFGGGRFGGNLVLAWQGRQYRIERFFDPSSPTRDTCCLFRNGTPVDLQGSDGEIGMAVFGLDEESFSRVLFIHAAEIDLASTDSIGAKLRRVVEEDDGTTDYAGAVQRLEDACKRYKPARGKGGLIQAQQDAILHLREDIQNYSAIADGLETLYNQRAFYARKLNALEEAEKAAQEAQRAAQEEALLAEKWARYDLLEQKRADCAQMLETLRAQYPMGFPDGATLASLTQTAQSAARQAAAREAAAQRTFRPIAAQSAQPSAGQSAPDRMTTAGDIPDPEQTVELRDDIEQCEAMARDILRLRAETEALRVANAHPCNGRTPAEEDIARAETELQAYADFLRTCDCTPRNLPLGTLLRAHRGLLPIAAVAALLLLAGTGLLAAFAPTHGAHFLAAGIFSLCVGLAACLGLCLRIRNLHKRSAAESQARINRALDLCAPVRHFLFTYGYGAGLPLESELPESDALRLALDQLRRDAAYTRQQASLDALEARHDAHTESVLALLARYGVQAQPDRLREAFLTLQQQIDAYGALQRATEAVEACRRAFRDTLSQFGLHSDADTAGADTANADMAGADAANAMQAQIHKIRRDCDEAARLQREIAALQEEAQTYLREQGLTGRPKRPNDAAGASTSPAGAPTVASGSESSSETEAGGSTGPETGASTEPETGAEPPESASACRQMLARLDRQIADDEAKTELLAQKETELAEAEDVLRQYKHRHAILQKTKAELIAAQQALQEHYIAPIRTRFCHYAALLEKTLGEKVTVDSEFHVFFERGGVNRVDKFLSAGQRALCMLCFRLALLDALFAGGEKPFLILDDPFLALDETHMQRAAELLHALSAEVQIVYLCCHESRKV